MNTSPTMVYTSTNGQPIILNNTAFVTTGKIHNFSIKIGIKLIFIRFL